MGAPKLISPISDIPGISGCRAGVRAHWAGVELSTCVGGTVSPLMLTHALSNAAPHVQNPNAPG